MLFRNKDFLMVVFNRISIYRTGAFFLLMSSIQMSFSSYHYCPLLKVISLSYRWWVSPDHSLPTLEQLNMMTIVPVDDSDTLYTVVDEAKDGEAALIKILKRKDGVFRCQGQLYKVYSGIPDDMSMCQDAIVLYSPGYSNLGKPFALSAYKAIKLGIIQGSCVIFECSTDTRRAFNFCQDQDLHCINLACSALLEKHPEAKIILKGGSKGAALNLRFLAEKAERNEPLDNIKAVLADSPPLSVKDALKSIYTAGPISHFLCRLVLPNYNPHAKTIMDAQAFPRDIPVLISSLPYDSISDLNDMKKMVQHLQSLGANIEHFVSEGVWRDDKGKTITLIHGKIGRAQDYQSNVKKFLAEHGLYKELFKDSQL